MIYADFDNILVPEDNGKQNSIDFDVNKYKKHIVCCYGNKLVCVDDKFSKPFKSYLGKDAVYNFLSSMIKESKCCRDVIKKYFNKELMMTKKMMKILRTLLNVGSVAMIMLMVVLK